MWLHHNLYAYFLGSIDNVVDLEKNDFPWGGMIYPYNQRTRFVIRYRSMWKDPYGLLMPIDSLLHYAHVWTKIVIVAVNAVFYRKHLPSLRSVYTYRHRRRHNGRICFCLVGLVSYLARWHFSSSEIQTRSPHLLIDNITSSVFVCEILKIVIFISPRPETNTPNARESLALHLWWLGNQLVDWVLDL